MQMPMSDVDPPITTMPTLEEAAARAAAARQNGHSRIRIEVPPGRGTSQFFTMLWRPRDTAPDGKRRNVIGAGVLGRIVGRRMAAVKTQASRGGAAQETSYVVAHVVEIECTSVLEAWRREQLRRVNEENGTAAAPVIRQQQSWGIGR